MPRKKKSSGRRYGKAAGKTVASAMRRKKPGTLESGPGGKGGHGQKPQAGYCDRPFGGPEKGGQSAKKKGGLEKGRPR